VSSCARAAGHAAPASLLSPGITTVPRSDDPAPCTLFDYRYASATTHKGSPGWLVMLALGWKIENVDERYWSVLMRREVR
jgi:hypothetical protein